MEIAELKIGNWVYRPCCNDQVVKIKENGIIGLDSGRGILTFQELKPIPFTEELFLKNNFTKQTFALNGKNNNSMYKLIKDTAIIQVSYVAESYVRVDIIAKENFIDYCVIRECIYVHELQNLYSELTKKELELEL